jgi:hypothetical protein
MLLLAGTVGCGAHQARTELAFGRCVPSDLAPCGVEVSDAEWQRFVDEVIVPRFPDGFTVVDGAGQWRDQRTGVSVAERSKLLILYHPVDEACDGKLDEVARAYGARFHQQSVLRADMRSRVRFIEAPRPAPAK